MSKRAMCAGIDKTAQKALQLNDFFYFAQGEYYRQKEVTMCSKRILGLQGTARSLTGFF